jgi:hypothetical protein
MFKILDGLERYGKNDIEGVDVGEGAIVLLVIHLVCHWFL